MEKQISPFYNHLLKALMYCKSNLVDKINMAKHEINEALKYKDDLKIRFLQVNVGLSTNDYEYLREAYEALIKLGDFDAYNQLGLLQIKNRPENSVYNLEEGVKTLKEGSDKGNAHCMFNLARLYKDGNGVERNNDTAIDILKKCIACNNPSIIGPAYFELGKIYKENKQFKEAHKYLTLAIKNKCPEANTELADLYLLGNGVEVDYNKYLEYLTNHYNADSCNKLVKVFSPDGIGGDESDLLNFFIEQAARFGNAECAIIYAVNLTHEKNGDKSKEIIYWLEYGIKKSIVVNKENLRRVPEFVAEKYKDLVEEKIKEYLGEETKIVA